MSSELISAEDRFLKAVDLHQRGLLDLAIEEYQQALELEPGHLDVKLNLGALSLQKGNVTRAVQLFAEILEQNPTHSLALFNIGKAFLYQDDPQTALAAFERARELNPNDSEVLQCISRCLAASGRREEAANQMLAIIEEISGNATQLTWLGNLLIDLQRPAEAVDVFRKAVTAAYDSVEPLEGLISSQLALGQTDKAMTSLKRALLLQPGLSRLHLKMVDLLVSSGNVDEAVAHLQKARDALPNDPNLRAKAEELRRRMPILRKRTDTVTHQSSPYEVEVYDVLDALYDGTILLEEALERLRAFNRQAPNDLFIATELAHAVFQARLFPEAIERYSELMQQRPERPDIRIDLAKSIALHGDIDTAKECLTQALYDFPEVADLHLAYIEFLFLERDFETAHQNLVRALDQFPDHPHATFLLGYLQARLGNLDAAARHLQKLLQITPQDEEAALWYSRVMILLGRPEPAEQLWNTFHDPWRSLVEILARVELAMASGRTESIMHLLHDIGDYRPRFVEDHLLFGKAAFYAGDFNGALRDLELVLRADPDHSEALAVAAMIYLLRGKHAKFWKLWHTAIERDVLYAGVVAMTLRPVLKPMQLERLREETRKLFELSVGNPQERNLLWRLVQTL